MIAVIGVFIGGGLGAVCRYAMAVLVARHYRGLFPLSTFIVNVTGSLLLGMLIAALAADIVAGGIGPWAAAGFFGGFTTFSTFAYDNLRLIEQRAWRPAAVNLALSGPLSFAGAAAGYLLVSGLA